jgi:hypothetical protein
MNSRSTAWLRAVVALSLALVSISFSLPLMAVDCSPDDITLSSQSDVDNFQADHGPGCDTVVGELLITLGEMTNLDGLSGLTTVGRNLRIELVSDLTDLSGLSELTTVGHDLRIELTSALTNVNGFSSLTTIGRDLRIQVNSALTHLNGLSSLSTIGQDLRIEVNSALTDVDGLSSLSSVGGDLSILVNGVLTNLDGLSAVVSVGQDLVVDENDALADCTGLVQLVDAVDDAAPGPGPGTAGVPDVGDEVVLRDNLTGCNSISEILGSAGPFSITPGLGGNWWSGLSRDGEGVQAEVARGGDGGLVFLATIYAYDTMGNQIFLVAVGPVTGDTAMVDVFITDGGLWGAEFDPVLVEETQWGTGLFTGISCGSLQLALMPNADAQAMGYTDQTYDLVRLTTPAISCP